MSYFKCLVSLLFFPVLLNAQTADKKLQAIMNFYATNYESLEVPGLRLSYESILQNLGTVSQMEKQEAFFTKVQKELEVIDSGQLSAAMNLEYEILSIECDTHLERIRLSKGFLHESAKITDEGIFHHYNGKEWYACLVQWWTSDTISPPDIKAYGRLEAKRVKEAMAKLESGTPRFFEVLHSDTFLTTENALVIEAFEKAKKTVGQQLVAYFPDYQTLPDVAIAQGTNSALAQVPGFYQNNTLYYNLFDAPFDLRTVDWLFLHEANPGHHFQLNYEGQAAVPEYRSGLSYSGFREGWAAYIENLGSQMGLYQTPWHYYSKWEWDLIRSVRLVLDVGINYEGWTNEEALAEWQQYIVGQDDIGMREIRRMRRWPAQVLTYKIGEKAIREAYKNAQKESRNEVDLKDFHTRLLSKGCIPVHCIAMVVAEN